MKINIFFLFLIFCFITFSLEQNYILLEPGENVSKNINGDEVYQILLNQNLSLYEEYFRITLESKFDINPQISISKDDKSCIKNRIYSGSLSSDPTYYFIKKEQIDNNNFYICFSTQIISNEYTITIANEAKAYLPLDSQTNYLVNENMTKMRFNFILNENKNIDYINFWVKGRNIKSTSINSDNLKKSDFSYGHIFHGVYISQEYELDIESELGEFITIGSISFIKGKTDELKENSKEKFAILANSEDIKELCFPIKYKKEYGMEITGKIYSKKAKTYFKDQNGVQIDKTETIIDNGILNDLNIFGNSIYGEQGQFCITNIDSNKQSIIFSIQMTSNKNISLIHPPLIPGEIRRHFLFEGEIAVFYGLNPKKTAEKLNLNSKMLKGFPEMYFDECYDFPNCKYDKDSLEKLDNPFPSNNIAAYSFYIKDKIKENIEYNNFNPISNFQPVMIVFCSKGEKQTFYGERNICLFDTFYFSNEDYITLYEAGTLSQYLLKDERDKYKINLENEINVDKIYLDLLLLSGEVQLNIKEIDENNVKKYYASNKMYFIISVTQNIKEIAFEVIAQKNSFYIVQYQLFKENDDSKYLNKIESGINFISSIQTFSQDESKKKYYDLINYYKSENKNPYLITFYSPNSKFNSYIKLSNEQKESISSSENSGQMVLEKNIPNELKLELDIINTDRTKDESKTYMIYVSILELIEEINFSYRNAITLSEGVPHRYIFTEKYPTIHYAYHISDYSKTVFLNFILEDSCSFFITIRVMRKYFTSFYITKESTINIEPYELLGKCLDNQVCTIFVTINMNKNNINNINKTIDFNIYQMKGLPIYLEKNLLRNDVIYGNVAKHYYFDLDSEEFGDITLDFKRGSGNIFASIQPKVLKNPMENPDWRGIYKFPKSTNESLSYAFLNKKIIVEKRKCTQGCYVLISVVSNFFVDEEFPDDLTPYKISINPRIISSNGDIETSNPKVKIKTNEIIIGDINLIFKNKIKYDYYEISLPYDSEYIYLDFQGFNPSFIINVGKTRPSLDNKATIHLQNTHFEDYVYKYTKEEILKFADSSIKSLKDIVLTIGIYSQRMNSIYSSPYAFKVFMPSINNGNSIDIIQIQGDQKVQCLNFLEKNTNKYLCYFSVVFTELDNDSNLIVYPRSHLGEELIIYGNLFDADIIEKNDISAISKCLNEIYLNKNFKQDKKYIYLNNISKEKFYLFITVSEKNDIIEVLSSTNYYYENMTFYPNPSTSQIFALNENKLRCIFETTKDLSINIVSISEEGYFHWESKNSNVTKKYYLNGFEERLSLSSYTKEEKEKSSSLNIELPESALNNKDNSGFIFYMTYYPRNVNNIIEQINPGTSMKINYRTGNMPLCYFASINKDNSYIINFNLYENGINNNQIISYDNNLLNIWGTIMSEEDAIRSRSDSLFRPIYNENYSLKGIFDLAFGTLSFDKEYIKKFNQIEYPMIYITVEDMKKNLINYDYMSLEVGIHSNLDNNKNLKQYAPEKVYLNGKLTPNNKRVIYMLKYDSNNPYLRLEFSSNNELIECILSTNYAADKNDEFQIEQNITYNGKTILTVYLDNIFFEQKKNLYLIIFTKDNLKEKLRNYVFKYMNTQEESEYFPYFVDNMNITFEEEEKEDKKKSYKINFYPIESDDISYYIRAIYKNGTLKEEKMDTIAISETSGKTLQINNPKYEQGQMLSFILDELKDEIYYIKVLAKMNIKKEKVFLLYNPVLISDIKESQENNTDSGIDTDNKDKKDKSTMYIIIGVVCVLFVVLIILVVVLLVYKFKNKDLLSKVSKESFIENEDKNTDDNNLLPNDSLEQNKENSQN